jgi:hypothetical protein
MRLALMGGGLLLAIGGGLALVPGESEACRQARASNDPNAADICGHGGRAGGGHSSSGSAGSRSGSGDSSAVSRGGFGSTAAHAASGS